MVPDVDDASIRRGSTSWSGERNGIVKSSPLLWAGNHPACTSAIFAPHNLDGRRVVVLLPGREPNLVWEG